MTAGALEFDYPAARACARRLETAFGDLVPDCLTEQVLLAPVVAHARTIAVGMRESANPSERVVIGATVEALETIIRCHSAEPRPLVWTHQLRPILFSAISGRAPS